jgi:hypothetical protein
VTAGPGKTRTTAGPGKTRTTAGPGKTRTTAGPGKTRTTAGPGKTRVTKGPGKTRVTKTPRDNTRNWNRGPKRIAVIRDRRRFFRNNVWRTLVPIAALSAFVVGADAYYADGYVPVPAPVCTGITEDGCRLRWQSVPTEEGDSDYQCVQYCAQRNRTADVVLLPPPPPEPVMEPAPAPGPAVVGMAPAAEPPAAAEGPRAGCELTMYADANFQGLSSPVDDDQPGLEDDGWQNEIASINIKSGTWDFFTDEEYGGEMMRLSAGSYPTLDPKWSKHIGSFMCSEPAR